jgi:2Fe-2S ferredoxin
MPRAHVTDAAGTIHVLQGAAGESLMQLARAAGLPMLGECNGSMACATCHVIVEPGWAEHLPPPSDDEDAMLDTVFDLTSTSRLSCQIRLSDALDGIGVALPG